MEARRLSLVELKEMVRASSGPTERAKCDFSLFPDGMPSGCLVEVTGFGKTEFITSFLREQAKINSELRIAWIEESLNINPFALWQRELDMQHILFVETKECGWAIQQILQSQLFRVVVLSCLQFPEKDLRRFQLLVEKCEGFLFLLSENLHKSWVPSLQLKVSKDQDWNVEVLRRRGHG